MPVGRESWLHGGIGKIGDLLPLRYGKTGWWPPEIESSGCCQQQDGDSRDRPQRFSFYRLGRRGSRGYSGFGIALQALEIGTQLGCGLIPQIPVFFERLADD